MANKHFGEFGDVWKHLLLADLLARVGPNQYWETHAGSARYELADSPRRKFGAPHFHQLAAKSRILKSSDYYTLLTREVARISPVYPGSPSIAMAVLGAQAHYKFCDLDRSSLVDIQNAAREMGIARSCVEVAQRDGISFIAAGASRLSTKEARRVFVFIDPYWPLDSRASGINCVELLMLLASRGCRAVLWYGCTNDERVREMNRALKDAGLGLPGYTHFGIQLRGWPDEFVHAHVGLRRFGFVSCNIEESALGPCRALSDEMAKRIVIKLDDEDPSAVSLRLSPYSDGATSDEAPSKRSGRVSPLERGP